MKNQTEILANVEAIIKPSTWGKYSRIYEKFGCALETATKSDIWRYVGQLRKEIGVNGETLSWRTIRANIAAIITGIEVAARLGFREDNPAKLIFREISERKSPARRETRALDESQVRAVLAACENIRESALIRILFFGALRISEVINLNIGDVIICEQGMRLKLRDTKDGVDTLQPIISDAAESITMLVSERRRANAQAGDPLFIGDHHFRLDRSVAAKIFRQLVKRAGIGGGFGPHTARATAITQLLKMGCNYREVQEFSRHSCVQMVETYDKRRFYIDENPGLRLKY